MQNYKPLHSRSAHDLFLVAMKTNRKKESKQNAQSALSEKEIRSGKVNQAMGCHLTCTVETDAGQSQGKAQSEDDNQPITHSWDFAEFLIEAYILLHP